MSAPAKMRYRNKATGEYVAPLPGVTATTGESLPYDAAGTGRRAATWRAAGLGPNAALSYSQSTMVNRSRDAVRKNPLADQAIAVWESNAVGTGIKPQWKTSDAGLNRELGEMFQDWTDEADADGRLDFYGLQALAVRAEKEGGEVFCRLRTRFPEDMETVPLQLQLLESEFCPVDDARLPSRAAHTVIQGIEIDALGKRFGYWMYRQHPNDWMAHGGFVDALPHFVPAEQIAHVAQVRRPGQLRGEPLLSRSLIKLRDLDKYDDAELVRKQVAAMIAGFITHKGDDDPDAAAGDIVGAQRTADAGIGEVTWEPGTLSKLALGEDIKFSEPTEVGGSYEVFLREQKRTLAVAAGVMYEQLTGDYSKVNDRTFRASVNEFRRRAEAYQHHLVVFQLCRPVVRRWLDLALLADRLRLPRGMELRELRRVDWIPQGWAYIHPVQEVQAETLSIRAGLQSRSQAVSKRGESAEEIDRQNAADNARADELGVVYDSDGRKAAKGGGSGATGAEPGAGADSEQREEEEETAGNG
jgi:lambda family phage portal protein